MRWWYLRQTAWACPFSASAGRETKGPGHPLLRVLRSVVICGGHLAHGDAGEGGVRSLRGRIPVTRLRGFFGFPRAELFRLREALAERLLDDLCRIFRRQDVTVLGVVPHDQLVDGVVL